MFLVKGVGTVILRSFSISIQGAGGVEKSQKDIKEVRKCYKYGAAGYFKWKYLLRKKGRERNTSDSIGLITKLEESDELLIILEEPTGYSIFEMASEGFVECRESEGAVTVFEV